MKTWADGNLDAASVSTNKSVFQNNDQRDRYLVVAVVDEGRSDAIEKRTDARMDDLINDLGERLEERHVQP